MSVSKQLYIGGELVAGQSTFDVINPATEQSVGSIAMAGVAEAEAALNAAQQAFPSWSTTSVAERVEWMHKLRDAVIANEQHLRDCIHQEMAKPWAATQDDFDSMVNSLAFYAEEIAKVTPEDLPDDEGSHVHQLRREPVGVAVAFLAWNFPLLNLAFKIGPAMAAGCPIVIKPSLQTPLSACAVGELCAEIGLPAGVVNIVCGDDQVVGDTLSASTIPALLTLIGSTRTGKHIMRNGATSIKRYSMELGGNAPALVFADSDLDLAADIVCALKFGNAGQICVTPNRVFVEESVAEEFAQKVIERAEAVNIGFDKNADIGMGPVIDGTAWERIDGLVNDALDKGAKLLTGGGRAEGYPNGHYYAPTALAEVNTDMRLYREEIFGPVISLMNFTDESSVLSAANDTDAGLSAFVFTGDLEKAERCASTLRFGEIQINGVKYGIDLPHCGIKQSGIGVDCSSLALEDYLAPKRVTRAL